MGRLALCSTTVFPTCLLRYTRSYVLWNRHAHSRSLIDVGGETTPTSPKNGVIHYHIAFHQMLTHFSLPPFQMYSKFNIFNLSPCLNSGESATIVVLSGASKLSGISTWLSELSKKSSSATNSFSPSKSTALLAGSISALNSSLSDCSTSVSPVKNIRDHLELSPKMIARGTELVWIESSFQVLATGLCSIPISP